MISYKFASSLSFLLFFVWIGCSRQASERGEGALIERPNVLFIALDDLNDWSGPLAGHKQALTPNLDAFGKDAVNFTCNYCTSPGCNPSRSTLLIPILHNPDTAFTRPIITTYDFGDYSVRYQDWHYIRYVDDSEELYNLADDPEEWDNLAARPDFESVKKRLADFIPADPVPLPEESLIPLQAHHIPPVKSREYYLSEERREWMKRFKDLD